MSGAHAKTGSERASARAGALEGAGRHVAVIGGGVAGIVAALDCAAAGARVTLLEVRRRLGGAAYSFERDGLRLDNGQHVFLRCCSAYRGLLERLGSSNLVHVQPRLEIPVMKPGSPTVRLRRDRLPPPLHLARSLARYPHLTLPQRLRAARTARALAHLKQGSEELEGQTLGEWLTARGEDPQTIAALWDLIALPTLNLPAASASLALGAFVFRTGLFTSSDGGDVGFHRATLSETIGDPAERALREAGVELRLGWRAERLTRAGASFEVHGGEDALSADSVVLALPHTRVAPLLEELLPQTAGAVARLGASPIVNLHVVYDREVCEEPFAAGLDTPVQYLFDRTAAGRAPAGSQYLAVSVSGAEREMQEGADALRTRYLSALAELLPRAREARVEYFLATREHAATFSAVPGVGALRAGASTPLAGLALAGAWTDTGWPATLEGAALSGHAAARAALGEQIQPALGAGTRVPARAG